MKGFINSSLTIRILFIALFAFLPAVGLSLYATMEQRQISVSQAHEETMKILRLSSSEQERVIEDAHRLLEIVAQLPAVISLDKNVCSDLFVDIQKHHPYCTGLGITSAPDGKLICTTWPSRISLNVADQSHSKRAIETAGFSVGEYRDYGVAGKPVLPVAYPVLNEKREVKAILHGTLDLSWLNKLASKAQLPPGATLTVIDRNGTILSRFPEPEKWSGKTLPEVPIIKTILNHPGEGTAESFGIDGVHRFYAYERLYGENEGGDIYIYSGIPASFVLASANAMLIRNLASIVFLTVIFFIMIWKGSDLFIVRRLKSLLTATEKLASGDLGARSGIPYETWEIGQLAQSFDKMAETLEQRTTQYKQVQVKLQIERDFTAAVLETVAAVVVVLDHEGNIILFNHTSEMVTGYLSSEARDRKVWDFLAVSEEIELVKETFEKLVSGEFPLQFENYWLAKNGERRLIRWSNTVLLNQENEVEFVIGTGIDITEQKDSERALCESEEKYRAVFETTGTATIILDEDGTISLSNAEFVNLTGYSREDVEGKRNFFEFVKSDELDRMQEYHRARRKVQDAAPRNYEFRLVNRQGGTRDIFMTVAMIPGTKKSVASLMDITDRKRAEEYIRQEMRRAVALAEISQLTVSDGLEQQDILDKVVTRVSVLFSDACMLCLLSEDKEQLIPSAFHHPDPVRFNSMRELLFNQSHSLKDGFIQYVIQSGQPTLVSGKQTDQRNTIDLQKHWPCLERFRGASLLITPLLVQGKPIGVLTLMRDQEDKSYAEEDRIFLQLLADRMSLGISNIRLYKEKQQQVKSLTALYESAQKLVQSLDIKKLAEDVIYTCVESFGVKAALLSLAQEDGSIRQLMQYPPECGLFQKDMVRWDETPLGKGPTGQAMRNATPVIVNDFYADPLCAPWMEVAQKSGVYSYASFPLISRNKPFGILNLCSEKNGFFTPERVKFFNAYSHQVAAALENARLFEKARRSYKRLEALRNIDMAITGSLDLRVTFNVILDQVTTLLRIHASDILLLNPYTQILEYAAGRGFHTREIEQTTRRVGEGNAGYAVLSRDIVCVPNLKEAGDRFARTYLVDKENFMVYFGVPLISKGQVKGVLELFLRESIEADAEWLEFLAALAGQAAIAIDNAGLFDQLQRSNTELTLAYDATIEGWSYALDLRDKETEGHSRRVTEMTLRLAQAVGVSETELVHIRRGSLLHDIGKLGVPDYILLKPVPLADEEWEIMKKHPTYAYEMLSPIQYLRQALDIPYCHHEKWDGTGYPRGLKGEQIPLSARVFALIDVWDALCSERPYRPAWPKERVLSHIKSMAGTHFDPKVVEVFLEKMVW